MKPETRAFLDMAAGDLGAARRDLAAEDPRIAVARAYYAAFHAACAALNTEGLAVKTHAGTHTLFGERFLLTGRLDRELGRTLSHLMQLRQGADYHVGQIVTMEEAVDAEARAAASVAAVEAMLAAP